MDKTKQTRIRQAIEKRIVSAVIDAALAAGYNVTVDDGEATPVKKSTNKREILKGMFSVDQEHLIIKNGAQILGWVFFVYGNDGWDVINDYTVTLEAIANAPKVASLIDKYSK